MTTNDTVHAAPVPTPAHGFTPAARGAVPVTSVTTVEGPGVEVTTIGAPDVAAGTADTAEAPVGAGPADAGTRSGGLVRRLRDAVDLLYREAMKFGAIGALAYVVDLYVYNLLRAGWWPLHEAPLGHKTVMCKVISVAVATVVAWLGNRYWTFRHRRRATARSEFALFVVMNIGGLIIGVACLGVSHYLLGLTSPLADNISANVVGLVLGTLFRFWAYRQFVFTELRDRPQGS